MSLDFVMSFPWMRFEVIGRAMSDVNLPNYAGSMLRSAVGLSLKRRVCQRLDLPKCCACPLREGCPAPHLIEPEAVASGAQAGLLVAPGPGMSGALIAGAPLSFSLTLLGEAVGAAELVLDALSKMEDEGFGAGRGDFEILSVGHVRPDETFADQTRRWSERRSVGVESRAPLHLVQRGRVVSPMDGEVFMRRVYGRVSRVCRSHWHTAPPPLGSLGPLPTVDRPEGARATIKRWSNPQAQVVRLKGWSGSFTLNGDLSKWGPLLALGEVMGVGKQTSMGLGRYRLVRAQTRR